MKIRFITLMVLAGLTALNATAFAAPEQKDVKPVPIKIEGGIPLGQTVVGGPKALSEEQKKEMEDRVNFVSKFEIDLNKEISEPYLFDIDAASLKFTVDKGQKYVITVNEVMIDSSLLGKSQYHKENGATSDTYYGVPLETGKNTILVSVYDAQTNEKVKDHEVIVFVKGLPDKVTVHPLKIPADGKSVGQAVIEVKDKWGNPVANGSFVTIGLSKGTVKTTDQNPNVGGLQVKVENGKALVDIISASEIGNVELFAKVGELEAKNIIEFTTPFREPIFLGLARNTSGYSFVDGETFEGDPKDNKGFNFNLGAAVFTQGTIFDDYLLTMALNTQNKLNELEDENNILFRDRAEDRLYPIYGDSSQLLQLATANSNLYLKLEKDKSSFLWGDFSTGTMNSDITAPRMSNYNRVLTGARLKLDLPQVTDLELFGAMSRQSFNRDEIRAAGVSGPYFTSQYPIVNGTERIVIETRDRVIENKILKTETLTRLTDYNIDYSNGSIIFSQPVSSFDENLNPKYIVVIYEYLPNNFSNSIFGVRLNQPLPFGASVGGTYIREISDTNPYQLFGLTVGEKLGDYLDLFGEYANSFAENKYGSSYRLGLSSEPFSSFRLKGEYQYVEKDFINRTGSSFTPGSDRYLLNMDYKPFDFTTLMLNYDRSRNFDTNKVNQILRSGLTQDIFSHKVNLAFEGRNFPDPVKTDNTLFAGLLGIGYQSPEFYGISINAGREQNLLQFSDPTKPSTTSFGADYRLFGNTKLFAKQTFLEAKQLTSATIIGVDTGYNNTDAHYFNAMNVGAKYQIDGAIDGRSAQTRIGLNNKINVLPELALGVAYERVSGSDPILNISNDHNAWSFSAEYIPTDIGLKASAKYDMRDGTNASNLINLNAAGALGDDFGVFGRFTHSFSENLARRASSEGLFGLAYRPIGHDFFNALFKYEIKRRNEGIDQISDVTNNILSVEGFYQPEYKWEVYTKLAYKNSFDQTGDYEPIASNIGMALGRVTYKLNYNFDLVGEFRNLTQFETMTSYNDVTAEVGYFPVKDLRVALGYNLFGYSDKDLITSNYTAQGPYVNLSFKLHKLGNIWGQEEIITQKDLLEINSTEDQK